MLDLISKPNLKMFQKLNIPFEHNVEIVQKIREMIESNPEEYRYEISKIIFFKEEKYHQATIDTWIESHEGLIKKEELEQEILETPIIKLKVEEEYCDINLLYFSPKNKKDEKTYVQMNAVAFLKFNEFSEEKKNFINENIKELAFVVFEPGYDYSFN